MTVCINTQTEHPITNTWMYVCVCGEGGMVVSCVWNVSQIHIHSIKRCAINLPDERQLVL